MVVAVHICHLLAGFRWGEERGALAWDIIKLKIESKV